MSLTAENYQLEEDPDCLPQEMQIIKANFFNSTQVTVALGEREDVQRERRQFSYKGYQSPTSSHLLPLINAICYQTKTTRLLEEDSQSQDSTPNHGDYNECELSEAPSSCEHFHTAWNPELEKFHCTCLSGYLSIELS
ncbi:unnamed protein product [Rangifer tarandus platyrhynchus]|uniref:Uncharacterized protein n=2 Tax=Rangifer tarandus platyrhynchus TaxID=3082113 RepID=A0ABN8ZV12_RANTA|nr:unnamed protein product [Rangifer tarandus platyrhynchus]